MKVIVLAAGYATRLYPLTLSKPKPLLMVAGKPMINYVLDHLAPIEGIDGIYIVTNAKFAGQFEDWASECRIERSSLKFTVVNDGSTDESNKLGAIGDLHLVLQREAVDDDVIVVAADNLFSESLEAFGAFCREKDAPVVGVYDVKSLEEVRKYNDLQVDREGRILGFVEKPSHPKGTLVAIALYFYPRATLPLIHQYIREGENPDQPGRLVQWLYPRTAFYTWQVPGIWYDIGSKEMLAEANRIFGERRPDLA